eukprot:CAMPEP_0204320836 /NCGR_PEP_ID=MMETSP0469-20131031/7844_1 /ASSEMBLY_ACC=CAM_ASM_000384 /TAXON_ID=2969 /ORGANISM="Oxyrrhis marina" /LENGTH=118 /DNA_ID=CAMNT_0051302101 /DNA_START=19 /DNA_END=375 /DNA_ORIENTATION=-
MAEGGEKKYDHSILEGKGGPRVSNSSILNMSLPGSLDVEGSEYRKASNSCSAVRNDLTICFKESKCFKEAKRTFDECLHSNDPNFVGEDCLILRNAYSQCRRSLLNPNLRFRGNYHSR